MMIVAALEHAVRTARRALAERCTGFSSYENGDYLQAEAARLAFVEQEGEDEVAEPRNPQTDPLNTWSAANYGRRLIRDALGPYAAPQSPAASAGCGESSSRAVSDPPLSPARERPQDPPSTTSQSARQPSVDGEGSPADSDLLPSPAGERPSWVNWAIPAIQEVLAEHAFWVANHSSIGGNAHCLCGERPHGAMEWREHIAPVIAERLDTAWRAKQSRQHIETGHDMGASIASEFFPQSQKRQK